MNFRKIAFLCFGVFQYFNGVGQSSEPETVSFFSQLKHSIYTQYHAGKSNWDGYTVGSGIQYTATKTVGRFLAVGVGGGIESFNLERGETVLPLYAVADFSGQQKKTFPYVRFAAGWGFPSSLLNEDILSTKGGVRLEPSAGMRFGTKSNISFFGGLSYLYQKATFESRPLFNLGDETTIRHYKYKRISLLVGVQF